MLGEVGVELTGSIGLGGLEPFKHILYFALVALRDLGCQSPGKNLSALGAFVVPDTRVIDKFNLSG